MVRGRLAPPPMEGKAQGRGSEWRSTNWRRQLHTRTIHQDDMPSPPPSLNRASLRRLEAFPEKIAKDGDWTT